MGRLRSRLRISIFWISFLVSADRGQCWTLGETGNWRGFKQSNNGTTWSLQQTRSANTVNELTTINATVGEQWADPKYGVKYDANGNMTTIPRPGLDHPSWANLKTDQWSALTDDQWAEMEVAPTFKATYDTWNRLVKLTDGRNGETVQENEYDGRGYRIVTKTYTDGTLTETRHAYFTDQWRCIEERLGMSTTPNRQFVWGIRYIDDLILRDRSISGGTLAGSHHFETSVKSIRISINPPNNTQTHQHVNSKSPDFILASLASTVFFCHYSALRQDKC